MGLATHVTYEGPYRLTRTVTLARAIALTKERVDEWYSHQVRIVVTVLLMGQLSGAAAAVLGGAWRDESFTLTVALVYGGAAILGVAVAAYLMGQLEKTARRAQRVADGMAEAAKKHEGKKDGEGV